METRKYELNANLIRVTIYPVPNNQRFTVELHKRIGDFSNKDWNNAEISWSSYGTVDRNIAYYFSEGIKDACKIAEILDKKIERYMIIGFNKNKKFEMIWATPTLEVLKKTLEEQITGNDDIVISEIVKIQ